MRPSIFFFQLTVFSLLVGVLLFGLKYIPQIADYQEFIWMSWGFFIFLCILIYGMAWLGKKQNNTMLNFRLGIFFNFLKIIGSLIFVLFYHLQYQPATHLFVLPFFLIYTLYTIFELYFLTKLFND